MKVKMNYQNQKPSYKHDCSACRFLGNYNGYDLYICLSKAAIDITLIARFSNNPSHYASTLVGYTQRLEGIKSDQSRALRVALLIAEEENLLPKYKTAHSEGYRVLYTSLDRSETTVGPLLLNEREAYREAFKDPDVHQIKEIVQRICTTEEEKQ